MKILVCGGRDYDNEHRVGAILNAAVKRLGMSELIHGGARGADALADAWARRQGFPVTVFPADWKAEGRAAGPRRNQRMLDEGKPQAVIAFAGGRGTADMIQRAKAAGIPVHEVSP